MRQQFDSIGRRLLVHLPALGVFLILGILLTWPLARDMRHVIYSWGDPVFQSWTLGWNWHALTTDPLHIFDANVFYPWRNTLAYSDHLFGQTLLALPVLMLTGEGMLANNVAVLTAFILSGFMMYLLVYDLTGNRVAGILAGAAYAFAPSRMAHLEHLHLLSMQWPPLLLLCLRRLAITTNRSRIAWAIAMGAAFLMQGLSGVYFLYFSVVMLMIAGAVYLAFALIQRKEHLLHGVVLAAGACAVAGILLLPTLLPYLRVQSDLDFEREPFEVTFWSAKRSDYLAAWPDNRLWNEPLADNFRHIEQALFPGLAILVLAVIGLTHPLVRREKWVLLAVTFGSVLLSFGLTGWVLGNEIPLPYKVFYEYLPGFKAIRVPARFGMLALVGLGGLAGLGIDRVWRLALPRLPNRRQMQVALAGLTVGLLVVVLETLTIMDLPDPLPVEDVPEWYAWMAENPAPSIELPMGEGEVASAWPNFWSMMHWNQLANGYSGLVPPTYLEMRERMKAFPDDGSLELLQGIGIETVVIHEDFDEQRRAELDTILSNHPEIEQQVGGTDAVYSLAPDPWMWRLVAAVPEGQPVALPNVEPDTLAFGLFVAILQREGHDVSGNGSIGYLELSPSANACHLILHATDDPSAFGYPATTVLAEEHTYRLYHDDRCGS